eukprot:scaffold80300_cov75-Phaeocystis_antarctica.AAC.1
MSWLGSCVCTVACVQYRIIPHAPRRARGRGAKGAAGSPCRVCALPLVTALAAKAKLRAVPLVCNSSLSCRIF